MNEYLTILEEYDFSGYQMPTGELKRIWEQAVDNTLKAKIQIEMDCLNFSLSEGEINPMHSIADENGVSIDEYPSKKNFDEVALEYLISRLNETQNKRLKARYGQILWNLVEKNKGKYVQKAVDALYELLAVEESADDGNFYLDFGNLLFLSLTSKYQLAESKQKAIAIILNSVPPFDPFNFLIPKILKLRKYFKKHEMEMLIDKAELIWQDAHEMSLHIYERIAENTIEILKSINKSPKVWCDRMGLIYERCIDSRKDDETGMIPLDFCERSVYYYKLGDNRKKEKELLIRMTHLKANLKLATIEIPFSTNEILEIYDDHKVIIKSLLERDADHVIGFLCNGAKIFPTITFLKKMVAGKKRSFEDFMHVIKYDINKNSGRSRSKENQLTDKLLEEYSFYAQIVAIPFLREIFKQGLYEQKVNFKTVAEFLYTNSWIGKNITYRNSGGEPYDHNWLALIAPSLMEFFFHWQAFHYSKSRYQNFILCIDSLALKFEGMLRDFAKVIGARSLVQSKGRIREAYIEELLEEDKIKSYFNEDDLLFFKYLFTTQGRNVRNNVAHSFYKFHHYKPELMILIIMAVLRISKYQIKVDKIVL